MSTPLDWFGLDRKRGKSASLCPSLWQMTPVILGQATGSLALLFEFGGRKPRKSCCKIVTLRTKSSAERCMAEPARNL
jgi:hypothetical protein